MSYEYRALTARSEVSRSPGRSTNRQRPMLWRVGAPGGLSDSLQRKSTCSSMRMETWRQRIEREASTRLAASKGPSVEKCARHRSSRSGAPLLARLCSRCGAARKTTSCAATRAISHASASYADSLRASVDPGSHLDTLTAIYVVGVRIACGQLRRHRQGRGSVVGQQSKQSVGS